MRQKTETKKLEIKNFNGRTYQLQTYTVKSGHAPLNKLRPLAIVVPGGSFTHLSVKEGEPVALAYEEALFKNKVKCEAHMFDIGYHGYSLATPELSTEDIFWQGNPHTARWFNLSLEWLDHLFSGINYDENKDKLT
ncbi:hypothetical protein [Lactobacillus delbrueckii]|uniref:hypothetical protein n=1 Tax=Lactobacillus delbrueckii TaxID=1584 RepID=UPI0011CAFD1F|nr:hypothetical protein [Lactobacillus delbrueckii]TXG03688.1 hypothetical protein FU323_09320 [Lactobacillus delbrueckii subsp. bulgaricus]